MMPPFHCASRMRVAHLHVYVHTPAHTCICVSMHCSIFFIMICMHTHMRSSWCVYMPIHMHAYMHTNKGIRMGANTCGNVCVCGNKLSRCSK